MGDFTIIYLKSSIFIFTVSDHFVHPMME